MTRRTGLKRAKEEQMKRESDKWKGIKSGKGLQRLICWAGINKLTSV
jgi:hypothetical protein